MQLKVFILAFILSSCSLMDYSKMANVKYDNSLSESFVHVKMKLNMVDCENKFTGIWNSLLYNSEFMKEFAEFRDDPQKQTAAGVYDNVLKAYRGDPAVCNRWIKLTKIRMNALAKAWSKR